MVKVVPVVGDERFWASDMLEEDWRWTARVLLSDPDVLETAAKQFRGIGCATD